MKRYYFSKRQIEYSNQGSVRVSKSRTLSTEPWKLACLRVYRIIRV